MESTAVDHRHVHSFAKNAREDVRVGYERFKGRDLIDLRVYYRAEDGTMRPTPRGLTISRELLPELEAAVQALRLAESGAIDLEESIAVGEPS